MKKVEIVTMTPEWSAQLLETNINNRPVSHNRVSAYTRDMHAGNWRFNGDAIRIRKDGTLADGQHRLRACVLSGVSFQTVLVTDLDDEDVLSLDQGAPRRAGENLRRAYGVKDGRNVAATVRILACFAHQDAAKQLTASEINEILTRHPLIPNFVAATKKCKPAKPAHMAAICYVGSVIQKADDRSSAFFRVFESGLPDYENCAAHRLRERILHTRLRGDSIQTRMELALFASAWEKFVVRKPVKFLKVADDFRLKGWDEKELLHA